MCSTKIDPTLTNFVRSYLNGTLNQLVMLGGAHVVIVPGHHIEQRMPSWS